MSKLVRTILESNPYARNSDNYLYYKVCERKLQDAGLSITGLTFAEGLLKRKELGLPQFETVRRARQKAQECSPSLRSSPDVEAMRELKEEEYRDFSRKYVG